MADEAAPIEGAESPVEGSDESEPTTPTADPEATWKRRIAGKDQALTRITAERDAHRAELAEAQRKLAEYERANLSEVEKLQRELADLRADRDRSAAEATRLRLKGEFPLAFQTLGDAAPLDETVLPDIEARLAELRGEPEEPRIDPNNPQRPRTGNKPLSEMSGDEAEAYLKSLPNPFLGDSVFGG